jgi:hypothetical protein
MVPRPAVLPAPASLADRWRALHRARALRLERNRTERDAARRQRRGATLKDRAEQFDIGAAIARAKARKQSGVPS